MTRSLPSNENAFQQPNELFLNAYALTCERIGGCRVSGKKNRGKIAIYSMLYVRKSRIWALSGEVMCKSPGSAVRPPAKSPGFGHFRHISSERIIRGP